MWQARRVVSPEWVRASTRPHVRIDDETEYGYLWGLKSFQWRHKKCAAYYMSGLGGNKVVLVPELDLVVGITSLNYRTRGAHQLTERLLTEYVLAAVER